MSHKFNINDRVVIHRPENLNEDPEWVSPYMDKFDGIEANIAEYSVTGFFYIDGDDSQWLFSDNWATLVDEDVPLEITDSVDFF